jgi:hypothetical protein
VVDLEYQNEYNCIDFLVILAYFLAASVDSASPDPARRNIRNLTFLTTS